MSHPLPDTGENSVDGFFALIKVLLGFVMLISGVVASMDIVEQAFRILALIVGIGASITIIIVNWDKCVLFFKKPKK